MPFCPVCKCEYVEGIENCPDCKVPLVDTLEESDAETEFKEIEELDEDDTDPECGYGGDGKYSPGIHIGIRNVLTTEVD